MWAYIYKLVKSNKYVFLSRPRRFGKSLLSSTLQCYFEGKREFFQNLAIEKLEEEWEQYPVFKFDMNTAKKETADEVKQKINSFFEKYEQQYDITLNGTPGDKLEKLIYHVYNKVGKKVVVIIDEYDAPVLNVLGDEKREEEVRKVMRDFYAPLKSSDDYIRFAFITGITKFSHLSIFSELNNLNNISLDDSYAAICGITQQEVRDYFTEDIQEIANLHNISLEEAFEKIKLHYDGYHFSGGLVDVYNPFSLFNALEKKRFDNYWYQTGTPTFLIKKLKDFDTELETLEGIHVVTSRFDNSIEEMTDALPLLYQTGYLTIKDYELNRNRYFLSIPNQEVRIGLMENLLPSYTKLMDVK